MKWLIVAGLLLVGFIIAVSFYLTPNDMATCSQTPDVASEQCNPADAIVVVSGGNTGLRTQTGIDLYQQGWAPRLVLSGAAFDPTSQSNAEAMRQQALAAGVPASAIILEEEARTTEENAANTVGLLEAQNLEKVILVTSAYHQQRANLEFKRHTQSLQIKNHPVDDAHDWAFWWWITPRGWWLAGGELVKITALFIQGDHTVGTQ